MKRKFKSKNSANFAGAMILGMLLVAGLWFKKITIGPTAVLGIVFLILFSVIYQKYQEKN